MILPAAVGSYEIPPHVRVGLYAKYRGIDVDREIQLMALWLEKNKARRPVKPIRFMERWLEKCKKPNNGGARHELAVPSNRASAARSHGSKGEQIEPMNPDGARNSQCGDWPPPPSNGASAQPANAHGCRGSQSPACSTSNGPATSDLCPPHTSASSLALTEMAGPTIKLATGPRPIGDLIAGLRKQIGVRSK